MLIHAHVHIHDCTNTDIYTIIYTEVGIKLLAHKLPTCVHVHVYAYTFLQSYTIPWNVPSCVVYTYHVRIYAYTHTSHTHDPLSLSGYPMTSTLIPYMYAWWFAYKTLGARWLQTKWCQMLKFLLWNTPGWRCCHRCHRWQHRHPGVFHRRNFNI
jgi:hypothetical protein